MVDLPQIPMGEVMRLGEMCKNPEQYVHRFSGRRRGLTWLADCNLDFLR